MDVSKLTEKPAGRLPIDTRVIPMSRMEEVIEGLARSMAQGNRAYWVCPLVEESEAVDLAAAEDRFLQLASRFKGKVGLVHGRMKGPDKDRVMAEFKDGTLKLLVSTTVIEVGVDVPEATAIVIENAERFGLAQLHQLRGRVGRGSGKIHLPAALPGAAGRNGEGAPLHHARDGGRLPHRRGRPAAARCGRNAGHAAVRPAAVPHGRPLDRRRPAGRRAR